MHVRLVPHLRYRKTSVLRSTLGIYLGVTAEVIGPSTSVSVKSNFISSVFPLDVHAFRDVIKEDAGVTRVLVKICPPEYVIFLSQKRSWIVDLKKVELYEKHELGRRGLPSERSLVAGSTDKPLYLHPNP